MTKKQKFRIGLLHHMPQADPFTDTRDLGYFKEAMERRGWSEDRVEWLEYWGTRDRDLTWRNAEALLEAQPDVIVSFMTYCNMALRDQIRAQDLAQPVVCSQCDMFDDLIESYHCPGGNFTGFTYQKGHNLKKLLVLLALRPKDRRIAHFYNPGYSMAPQFKREFEEAAVILGVELETFEVPDKDAFAPTIKRIRERGFQSVVIGAHGLFNTNGPLLGRMFGESGLATVGNQLSLLENGGVASVVPDRRRSWAVMVDTVERILAGENPATIPVNRTFGQTILNLDQISSMRLPLNSWLQQESDLVWSDASYHEAESPR